MGVLSAVVRIFNQIAMHAKAQASNRMAKANRASHGPRVSPRTQAKVRVRKIQGKIQRKIQKKIQRNPKVRTKVPKAYTRAKHRKLVSQVLRIRNRMQAQTFRNLHRHIPWTLPGTMVGSVTNATMAGVSMSGMTTGVLLDGNKVGNRRMTLPQAHFRLEVWIPGPPAVRNGLKWGERESGLRSCSEHVPIELWSRRSRRRKILSECDPRLVACACRNLAVDMFCGDGAAKRAFQRYVRWTVATEMATVRHHSYHKTTATADTDSHRPIKVAVFDPGIQVGVPRHHEFDVDSSPLTWWPLTMKLDWHQHLWTTVRKHLLLPAVDEYTVPIFHFSEGKSALSVLPHSVPFLP